MKAVWVSGPSSVFLHLITELLTVISGKFNNCIPRNNINFNIFLIYQYPPKHRITNDHQEGKHGRQNAGPSSSVQFSCSVVSDSLRPHGMQHTRPPCPSPIPRVYSNSYLLSPIRQWQPTTVLLPGNSHRQRSLGGCSPWSH